MPVTLARRALPKPNPKADPRFKRIEEQLKRGAAKTKAHPPAAKKAQDAAKAAKGPPNETLAGGKAKQVDKIKDAKEGKPDQNSFLALLRAEIAKAMPKNLGETENFDQTANQMKGGLKGNVAQQKENSTKDVSGASKQAPAPAGEAKAGGDVPKEGAPPAPNVAAAEGMPAPKSEQDVSLNDSKDVVNQQMKEAEVTDSQLKKANDPRFSAVASAKDQVGKNADAGPSKYRAAEKAALTSAASGAAGAAQKGAAAMIGVRGGSNNKVLSRQQQQKAADEAKRKSVVDKIESIYTATKTRVEAKLSALDGEVNGIFDSGVDAALNAMTSFVNAKIRDYKIKRYLSIPLLGLAAWVRDQFKGLPDEVNAFYEQGRTLFQGLMDALIVRVAKLVEQRLREAKAEVAKGQAEIKAFVASQPKELQQVAQKAQADVAGRFAELESSIEEKKNSLAQSLAQKYKEGFDKANEALKKIQDENKGLVQAFAEKLGEIIKMLAEFKAKLMGILRKGEETIKLIIADPVGFVGNLVAAVKGGLQAFIGNIWTHLKAGFMKWLFGNLPPGVGPPADLSLPSIAKLVLGVLGITYDKMRAKAVKFLGAGAVAVIEKLVSYLQTLISGGPAALWEQIKADVGNLKAMVIDAIQDWLISTIIKQAIMKIVSMCNPAGAIVQAIIAIYNIVMFVVEKAAQIMAFVESVINSVHAIATGAIGGAIKFIEQALANTIPLVIGFLARLIGLGGLSKKVHEFILKVQTKIDQAIDKVLKKIVDKVKKLFGKAKAAAKKLVEWWKKKKRFSAGGESHELSFRGAKSSAVLTVASNPQAVEAYVKEVLKGSPTAEQTTAAGAITPLIAKIKTEMSKPEAQQDGNLITTLFGSVADQLAILMGLADDKETKGVKIPSRRSWEITTLQTLEKRQPGLHQTTPGSTARPAVTTGQHRRHIVSSKDMAEHYETALNKKKWSIARVLLEKGGSGKARQKVEGGKKVNNPRILEAALARHSKFFNHADNLFVGPGKKNSALGRRLDPHKGTGMTPKEIDDYCESVKQEWALDGSFKATR